MDAKLKLIILITLFLISPVSAKFICGEVVPTDEVSPAWYEVKVYLMTNESYFSTCMVSPSNNRYCCDIEEDKTNYTWESYDIFQTKITDIASGYFATPEIVVVTGEGYDIAPNLILEKAIKIISPNTTLTISPVLPAFSAQSSPECAEFGQIQNNTKIQFTNNSIGLQTTFGKNEALLYAICNDQEFQTNHAFFVVESVTIEKEYEGVKIRKGINEIRIKGENNGTINIQGTLSSPVSGIELKEYVPIDFEIFNTSGSATVQNYNPSYNVIRWEVSGDNFDLTYSVKSPAVPIGMHEYNFITQIDEAILQEESVYVYNLIPVVFRGKAPAGGLKATPKQLSKVSLDYSLIFENENKDTTIALYSTAPKDEAELDAYEFIYDGRFNRSFKYIKSYRIKTNLNSTERGPTKFEYKTNRSEMETGRYKDIQFFTKKDREFIQIPGEKTELENQIKYSFETNETIDEIFIFGEKSKLGIWDKTLIFLNKVGLYDY